MGRCIAKFIAFACSLLLAVSACGGEEPAQRKVHQMPSLVLASPQVELAVTLRGGHMAPVTFFRDTQQPVQPYYVSPWQEEKHPEMPVPVLVPLRGDFFCLPFGGNQEAVDGEQHPPHGESAGSLWRSLGVQRQGKTSTLSMALDTQVRKGRITKELSLCDGHNVVYCRHTLDGFAGRMPLGHHATLALPERQGSARLAVSGLKYGLTFPGVFSDPAQREYQALQPGAKWTELRKVPMAWKDAPDADLTRFPARQGFADLVQLIREPVGDEPAWTTVTFPEQQFVWFSLKDPRVLTSTVMWMENRGRHGFPWNGRNCCLGLEDVTAFFDRGLAASTRDNLLSKAGVATAVELKADRPTQVRYVQGVVQVPHGFDVVQSVEFQPGQILLRSASNQRVAAPVHHEFLATGRLP